MVLRNCNWDSKWGSVGSTSSQQQVCARANFRRLLLRDSPSSPPPRLQKFNFRTALPTSVPTTVYLPESRFCHTSCTMGFQCIFKLVDFLSSGRETPWRHWHGLSVLKSHFKFKTTCKTVVEQLLSKCEKRFVGTHWLQEGLGLSEALCVSHCEACFVCWKEWVSIPKI